METKVAEEQVKQTNNRLWSINQIGLAAMLAGPFGGCYFLGQNYKQLGKLDHAKKSYLIGILATFALSTFFLFLPDDLFSKIPGFMIPTTLFISLRTAAEGYQKELIQEKLKEGYTRYSYWWAILIGLAMMVIVGLVLLMYGAAVGMLLDGL